MAYSDWPSWLKFTNYSLYGQGYETIEFSVDDNDTGSERYGYITVVTTDGFRKESTTRIVQPSSRFEASMSTTTYIAEGDYWYLHIETSSARNWTVSKSDSWVHLGSSSNTYSTYSGKGSSSLAIYVDRNTSSYSRSSNITITSGTFKKTITITQNSGGSTTALYPSYWTSTNHSDYSTSYKTWSFTVSSADKLSFSYTISSEKGCDVFNAKLTGAGSYTLLSGVSGYASDIPVTYTFVRSGTYTLRMEYVKDVSVSSGDDRVSVSGLSITRY